MYSQSHIFTVSLFRLRVSVSLRQASVTSHRMKSHTNNTEGNDGTSGPATHSPHPGQSCAAALAISAGSVLITCRTCAGWRECPCPRVRQRTRRGLKGPRRSRRIPRASWSCPPRSPPECAAARVGGAGGTTGGGEGKQRERKGKR